MTRQIALALFLAVVASGQDTRATLSGTVTDPTGAAAPGAAVNLTNVNTGVKFDGATNSAGQYRFLFLIPGTYKVAVKRAGFRNFEYDNLVLQVGQSAVVNVALQLGATTETVTVTSNAALLDTEKSDRGVVIDKVRITDLPLNVRNPIMLTALSPGITHTSGTAHLNPFSNSGISSWSVNGGMNNNTEFIMDGAPNNAFSGKQNRIAYVPPADAVEEFKVLTTVYDAQYGRTGGGVINVSSKSGTNAYHGTAYEFLKRPSFNANTFSNNAKGLDRQKTGLARELPISWNVTMADIPAKFGVLRHAAEREMTAKAIERLRIRCNSGAQKAGRLSGGNQQKVVISKWVSRGASVFLFDEPTRGIDIGAKVEVFEVMNELARQGAGILMVSSELPELLQVADRILVMRQGRLAGELPGRTTQEEIMRLATLPASSAELEQ